MKYEEWLSEVLRHHPDAFFECMEYGKVISIQAFIDKDGTPIYVGQFHNPVNGESIRSLYYQDDKGEWRMPVWVTK